MIVSSQFAGDTNEVLQGAQHDSYRENVGVVFQVCAAKIIEASELIQADAEVALQVRGVKSFDHRVLQNVHDIIAVYYRYQNGNGLKMDLLETAMTKEEYAWEWTVWLREEMKALSSAPYFVRAVINAVLFANKEIGYLAEDEAASYLVSRYQMREWARVDGYVKLSITPL